MYSLVDFPSHIKEKFDKGIISYTHLSDILRTALLVKYGGTWMDSTVFMSGEFPEYINNSNLFMYTHSIPDDITITYNSWLISSNKENNILKSLLDIIYEYWNRENYMKDYFLWHLLLTLVLEKYGKKLDCMYVSDELCETFARIMFNKHNKDYWNYLKNMTPIHKLTYKFNGKDIKGTYFEKIILE